MKVSGPITPCLWFDTQAEEAAKFYCSIFENSKMGTISYYSSEGQDIHGKKQGSVLTAEFEINGQKFTALNGGPQFKFTEAISLQVPCDTQREIDYFSAKLTEGGGEQGPCGWVKDKYGLSWQVFPAVMTKMLSDPDRKKVDRVFKAFMPMKKFDLAAIERAYHGEAA
jgi:predicted 3-demethylubiquinone-9 3-methyltransferase (glyoxalase superfamily)